MAGIRVPSSPGFHLTCGALCLVAAFYTFTITSRPRIITAIRTLLGVLACFVFCYCIFHPYDTSTRNADTGIGTIGFYGILRAIEGCFVDLVLGVHSPPRWVVDGTVLPLPTTIRGRIAYAIDYLLSLQGTSMFKNTTWDWIFPSTKRQLRSPDTPKWGFVWSLLWSLFKQYLICSALEALNESRIWDTRLLYPITDGGLNIFQQLIFAFSNCVTSFLIMSMTATLVSLVSVALGSPVEAWPPLFSKPFSAVSVEDFWTRWHPIFRRPFDRISLGIIHVLKLVHVSLPVPFRNIVRATIIFGLSTILHLVLMYRLPTSEAYYHPTFFDQSTMMFFLSQPIVIWIEKYVVKPLSGGNIWVMRIWAWAWLLYSGRWWTDVWVRRGLWEQGGKSMFHPLIRLWNYWRP